MKPIVAFVATAYTLSITLSLVVGLTGGHASPLIGLAYVSMFLPALSVLLVSSVVKERPRVQWDSLPLRFLPVAIFLIPVVLHAAMLPVKMTLADGSVWPDWLKPHADGLYHTPPLRGWGTLTIEGLMGRIVFNAIVGLAVTSFMAFFEEIGWRAWLLPRVMERMGARSAVVITSVIWGLWHVPFQLSGIQHIDGVSPASLASRFSFGIITAGLVLGWLWLRTKSIWLVSICHGALNNWGQYAFKYMKDSATPEAIHTDLTALTTGFLALLLIGALLFWRGLGEPPAHSVKV